MNTADRLTLGILGTVTSWSLDAVATGAAIVASVATAVFMALSAVEKFRSLRKK